MIVKLGGMVRLSASVDTHYIVIASAHSHFASAQAKFHSGASPEVILFQDLYESLRFLYSQTPQFHTDRLLDKSTHLHPKTAIAVSKLDWNKHDKLASQTHQLPSGHFSYQQTTPTYLSPIVTAQEHAAFISQKDKIDRKREVEVEKSYQRHLQASQDIACEHNYALQEPVAVHNWCQVCNRAFTDYFEHCASKAHKTQSAIQSYTEIDLLIEQLDSKPRVSTPIEVTVVSEATTADSMRVITEIEFNTEKPELDEVGGGSDSDDYLNDFKVVDVQTPVKSVKPRPVVSDTVVTSEANPEICRSKKRTLKDTLYFSQSFHPSESTKSMKRLRRHQ